MQQKPNSSYEPYPFVRLAPNGGDGTGVWCDKSGVYIGTDVALVEQRSDSRGLKRFVVAPTDRLDKVLRRGYGEPVDVTSLLPGLRRVAAALEKGDLALANIALVHMRIPPFLSAAHGAVAAMTDNLLKASADDPEHPGYPKGAEDGKGGQFRPKDAASAVAATTMAAEASGVAPLFGKLGPAALASLETLAAGVSAAAAGAVAFLGVLFIPTNRSLITQGTLPDQPGISYRYDAGGTSLQLYRNGEVVYSGQAGVDGIFRADDGRPIGRVLDGNIVLDPDAVADVAIPAKRPDDDSGAAVGAGIAAGAAGLAASQIQAGNTTRSEPKLCPDPGPDRPGADAKDIAYQMYVGTIVNGEPLPPGFAVRLWNPDTQKWVYFDDCRLSDGAMIDAKGTGYLGMLNKGVDNFPWLGVEKKMLAQARRQVDAANGRLVEWHFADKPVAEYMKARFAEKGLPIKVEWTPPPGSAP